MDRTSLFWINGSGYFTCTLPDVSLKSSTYPGGFCVLHEENEITARKEKTRKQRIFMKAILVFSGFAFSNITFVLFYFNGSQLCFFNRRYQHIAETVDRYDCFFMFYFQHLPFLIHQRPGCYFHPFIHFYFNWFHLYIFIL